MNNTAQNHSLATRARQLTSRARVKRDGLQESQDRGQVQTALNRLDQELVSLSSALNVYYKLKDIGVPVASPINLQQPAKKLQEQAALGRPTAQFLQARFRDVYASRLAIDEANTDAWRTWADQVIGSLPLALLPRVHFTRRNATNTRISAMRTLGGKKPNIPDIIQFQQHCDRVKDEFGEVGEARIDSLLKRFTDNQIRMADLSDDELEMLRGDASLSDQLYVRIGS